MMPSTYEVIDIPCLGHEKRTVVLPHPKRGNLLVPLCFLEPTDDAEFSATHSKAAFRAVGFIQEKQNPTTNREWYHVGWLRRIWTVKDE
jgi:hypothetical protein